MKRIYAVIAKINKIDKAGFLITAGAVIAVVINYQAVTDKLFYAAFSVCTEIMFPIIFSVVAFWVIKAIIRKIRRRW